MLSRRTKQRLGSTAAITLAALAMSTSSASAGVLVDAAPNCDEQTLSKPFTPWLDFANYTPLGGGDFESGAAGWTLNGAAVAAGNEPYHVAGPGASSLAIGANGSATSPVICVGLEHPTIRFFAKRTAGGLLGLGTLRVDVLFENNLGLVESLTIGVVGTTAGVWQPTLPMTVIANLLPLLSGDHTAVAFRFTSQLGGAFSVDDIQVDPYQRK